MNKHACLELTVRSRINDLENNIKDLESFQGQCSGSNWDAYDKRITVLRAELIVLLNIIRQRDELMAELGITE